MVKAAKAKASAMKVKVMKMVAMKAVAMKAVAMKALKTKKDNEQAKSLALTKPNVKKLEDQQQLDIQDKMDLFRKGQVSQSDFTAEEKRCLWNRFHAAKQLNADAAAKWDAIPSAGRGNQNLKNAFLWAWLKDPAWGKHFMERVNTLTVSQKHSKKLLWLTYKQLCDKHGKEEADDLIRSKSIHMRPNPKNTKFFQFLDEDEEFDITNEKSKNFKATQKGDIKPHAFSRLCAGLGTISSDDIEALHAQPDFGDLSEEDCEDDENDQTSLPASLKKLMGVKKAKKLKDSGTNAGGSGKTHKNNGTEPKSHDKEPKGAVKAANAKLLDEVERTCTVLGSDDKSAVMSKANKMHSIIAKVIKGTDPVSKKKLQMLMVKLQQKIFNKSSSGVKDLIIEGAKALKASAKK